MAYAHKLLVVSNGVCEMIAYLVMTVPLVTLQHVLDLLHVDG
jgi:hypothetical protein